MKFKIQNSKVKGQKRTWYGAVFPVLILNRKPQSVLDTSKSKFPLSTSGEVAQEILKTAGSVQPKTRVRIGRSAKMIPVLKSLMSDQAFDRMIMKQLGLTK